MGPTAAFQGIKEACAVAGLLLHFWLCWPGVTMLSGSPATFFLQSLTDEPGRRREEPSCVGTARTPESRFEDVPLTIL